MAPGRAYDFGSDKAAGVHPAILAAIVEANAGSAPAYGADLESSRVDALYSEVFERRAHVFSAPSGTAANGLALGAVTPPYGAVFCHEEAHIVTTECGAPEFFSAGARLVAVPGRNGKLTTGALSDALVPYRTGSLHRSRASALSLTQPTEYRAVYGIAEIGALADVTRSSGMKVHMDGARFASALARLGCSPADLNWKAGVDVLSFGTTKNGTMNAEAVIVFDAQIAETLSFMHKRAGFLQSKMRFTAVQLSAYLADGLWMENARRANATASRLAAAFAASGAARLEVEPEANEIFVPLSRELVDRLVEAEILLRPWSHPDGDLYRVVTSFSDPEILVSELERVLQPRTPDTV